MNNQYTVMRFDPATGTERPYPSHAAQWRIWYANMAWLYNPWSGDRRKAGDVGSDAFGLLILPPGEQLQAATEPPDDIPYRDLPEPQHWSLPWHSINKLQQRSIEQLVARCKQAHHTDAILRINGKYEVFEADWIKCLTPQGGDEGG